MTKYDDIWETAIDSHGLITSAEARELGVSNHELVEYARRGRLERVGQGVYRLVRYVPTEADPYALAVKLVGAEAFLFGESVIALLGLAPADPSRIYVATPRRTRKRLPGYLHVKLVPGSIPKTVYDGIPSQRAADAIRSARDIVSGERLLEAVREGRRLGYLNAGETERLTKELIDAEEAE